MSISIYKPDARRYQFLIEVYYDFSGLRDQLREICSERSIRRGVAGDTHSKPLLEIGNG